MFDYSNSSLSLTAECILSILIQFQWSDSCHGYFYASFGRRRVRFFKKIQEFENRFCVSLLNRSIQDFSYHSASKELKNPLSEWIFFGSFEAPLSQKSWIDLFSKETQNLFSDSFGLKNPILDFLKETHP